MKSHEWLAKRKATINLRIKMMINAYGDQKFLH